MATLLCIDPDPTARSLIEAIVNHRDHGHFLGAGTLADGLALAGRRMPDVVVVDLELPDGDGYQVLAELRANSSTEKVPVIALSASPGLRDEALETGKFAAIVSKPMDDIPSFVALLDRCLSGDGTTRRTPA